MRLIRVRLVQLTQRRTRRRIPASVKPGMAYSAGLTRSIRRSRDIIFYVGRIHTFQSRLAYLYAGQTQSDRVIFSEPTCPCRPLLLLTSANSSLADVGLFSTSACSGRDSKFCSLSSSWLPTLLTRLGQKLLGQALNLFSNLYT